MFVRVMDFVGAKVPIAWKQCFPRYTFQTNFITGDTITFTREIRDYVQLLMQLTEDKPVPPTKTPDRSFQLLEDGWNTVRFLEWLATKYGDEEMMYHYKALMWYAARAFHNTFVSQRSLPDYRHEFTMRGKTWDHDIPNVPLTLPNCTDDSSKELAAERDVLQKENVELANKLAAKPPVSAPATGHGALLPLPNLFSLV